MSSAGESPSGLSHMLSGGSRRSTNSRKTMDAVSYKSNTSDDHHSFRTSLEGAIDRLRHHDSSDAGDGKDSGLSKLVPKTVKSKRRRKKQEKEEEARLSEEAARGRAVAERGRLDNDDDNINKGDGDSSSLLTYESESESITAVGPPLTSHPLHTGYLTTSSPLVQTAVLPEIAIVGDHFKGLGHSQTSPSPVRSGTLADTTSPAPLTKETLTAPVDSSRRRSPSPIGRIRDAISTRRDSKARKSTEHRPDLEALGLTFQGSEPAGSRRETISSVSALDPQVNQQSVSASSLEPHEFVPTHRTSLSISTDVRPSTPPASDKPAPLIVSTPPTPVDKSSSRFETAHNRSPPSLPVTAYPNVVTSPSGNMISHRRSRTNSSTLGPSKLANITSAPLTPTPENTSTSSGGFFSSVFSAAQNAANTLSSSITNTSLNANQTRSRSGTHETKEIKEVNGDVEVETAGDQGDTADTKEEKEPAVRTLGMGDLSLSHLGISETPSSASTPVTTKFSEGVQRGRSDSRNIDDFLNGGPYGTGVISDTIVPGPAEEVPSLVRPRSISESFPTEERSPPNGSVFEGKAGIGRTSSIRSAMGTRRKRNSSAATGTTIGAAIAAANASLVNPAVPATPPKLTGFAVASKKRNRDFHQLFRSVPDDDYLIEDYSCALQREILAHGRLYVSEGHLCFSSNIFGWVNTLVMSFDEIVTVEKRSTALLFKNGLMVSTLHAKNIFASFTSRDSTYDLIVGIWKLSHPSLRSSLNGVRIDETGGDKTEKDDGLASQSGSGSEDESEEGDEIYDEDEDENDDLSYTQAEGSMAESEIIDRITSRKPSAVLVSTNGVVVERSKDASPPSGIIDFPGPATHGPTLCTDTDTHYDKILADEVIPAPLGKVYNLVFGPGSVTWMAKWLTTEQKCTELQMEDKIGLTTDNKIRSYSYIKPLNGSIGPRQTKCLITETLDFIDLEKAVSITSSTQTPDVPSGSAFTVKTKYCLSWGEGNTTRLQMNCTIDWTAKSWLKGPIEKGANDGQAQFAKDIVAALKISTASRARAATTASGAPSKGRKKGRKGGAGKSGPSATSATLHQKIAQESESWGMLETVRPILGPVVNTLKPVASANMVYGLLVGLLVAAWLGWGGPSSRSGDVGFYGTPERIAAYAEIWRREESQLWEWLEERVGMDDLHFQPSMLNSAAADEKFRSTKDKLRDEKLSHREMETAIRTTEEKLAALKKMVERGKGSEHKEVAEVRSVWDGSEDRPYQRPDTKGKSTEGGSEQASSSAT